MSSHIGGKLDVPAPQVGAVPGARSSFRFAKSILARLTGFPVLGGVQTAEVPEVISASDPEQINGMLVLLAG